MEYTFNVCLSIVILDKVIYCSEFNRILFILYKIYELLNIQLTYFSFILFIATELLDILYSFRSF